jgi:hypothetical protein
MKIERVRHTVIGAVDLPPDIAIAVTRCPVAPKPRCGGGDQIAEIIILELR